MKKALLLGASGYLGSVLYEILNRRGWEVTGTCRGRCGQRHVPLDVTDRERLAALIGRERPGAIVWSLMSGTDEARLIRAGLGGLLALIEPATRFVFVSTDGVFPGNRGNYSEADATAYWQAGHELAAYCSAKLDGERMTRERHDNHVIVRTGPIYGPDAGGQWDRRVRTLLASLERGERVVRSGNVFRTFVHVEDLASALAELLDSEWRGTLHLGPGGRESYWSFCRKMARRFGLDPAAIEENVVTPEEAAANGILLDTTLDTRKAQALLATRFRSVDE